MMRPAGMLQYCVLLVDNHQVAYQAVPRSTHVTHCLCSNVNVSCVGTIPCIKSAGDHDSLDAYAALFLDESFPVPRRWCFSGDTGRPLAVFPLPLPPSRRLHFARRSHNVSTAGHSILFIGNSRPYLIHTLPSRLCSASPPCVLLS